MSIEFVHSAEFERPQLGAEILRPWTACLTTRGESEGSTGATSAYLASLNIAALLSPAQEFHLFRQMNYHKFLAVQWQARLRRRRSQHVAEQMERALAAARDVRDEIVQSNLRLVVSIAKTMTETASSLDDLISEGHLPLLRAVEIFDFTRGLRFSTYATWAIRNGLIRYRQRSHTQRQRFVSGAEDALRDAVPVRESASRDERDRHSLRQSVAELLDDLGPRERLVVSARYGLEGEPRPQRLHEIAGRLNLSTERVRQLLTRSLTLLRERAEALDLSVA